MAALGTAMATALGAAAPATARRVPAAVPLVQIAPAGPAPCRDWPVSSAVVEPTRCWRTGPRGWVVVGPEPAHPGTAVMVVGLGQAVRVTRRSGAAGARILSASAAPPAPALAASALGRAGVGARVLGSTPLASASYYVYGGDALACSASPPTGCPLYAEGAAEAGAAGGIVVLDFGAPCYVPGTAPRVYGTQLFGDSNCTADPALVPLLDAWLAGYATTHGPGSPLVRLAAGTSNSLTAADPPAYALTDSEMQAAGAAWASEVVGAVATAGRAAPVTVWGASDMEQSGSGNWYGPLPTIAFVQGFGSVTDPTGAPAPCLAPRAGGLLADYGDDVVGNGGWSAAQIYAVAYGLPAACALPEIYYTSMAQEWAALNQWAVAHPTLAARGPITVLGAMDEPGAGLTPAAAWGTLQADLGQSPPVPYLTVIGSQLVTASGVTAITPSTGPITGGTAVTITGTGLGGATGVHFGLRPATFSLISGTEIRALSPFQPEGGSVAVTVTTRAGTTPAPTAPQFLYLGGGPTYPLPPVRVLDTRVGLGAPMGAVGPDGSVTLRLTGVGGVPGTAVGAVFLNVTVVHPTQGGFLTVYPAGQPRPLAAAVNFAAGRTTATLVEVAVGAGGSVVIGNGPGTVQVVADLLGWTGAAPVPEAPPPPSPTPTPIATATPSPIATATPTPSASALPTPMATPSPGASATPGPSPTAIPTSTPTPIPTPTPTPTPMPTPTPTPAPLPVAGLYEAIAPARIADTRAHATAPDAGQTLGPGGTLTVAVAGRGGVPLTGAEAVSLEVTVTGPTAPGYLAVYPAGGVPPTVSTLNFVAGETVANQVVVGLGAGGAITVANRAGRTNVLVDVTGWFTAGTAPAPVGGQLHPLMPIRVVDTRPGSQQLDAGQPLGPGATLGVLLAGADGLPPTGVQAVVLHVTATEATGAGYLTAYPDGSPRPSTSDLNWTPGQTVGNLVIVPVGPDGRIDLFNAAGTVDVVVDLVGWFG